MKDMKNKDGIRISKDFLSANAEKLKRIPNDTPIQRTPKVIQLWRPLAIAATLAVTLFFALPEEEKTTGIAFSLEGIDLYEVYSDGYIDLDEELLYYEMEDDDLFIEVDLEENQLDVILEELSEDELYNLMEG